MKELSLHVLDLVENSVTAGASDVRIRIEEDTKRDTCTIEIEDNGRGMNQEEIEHALDPFYTTKKGKHVGVGLSLFAEAARRSGGDMRIDSKEGQGIRITAEFGLTHIDRQPLGDIGASMVMLIVGNPSVDFSYEHRCDGRIFTWTTDRIHDRFGNVPRTAPEVTECIQSDFKRGLEQLRQS